MIKYLKEIIKDYKKNPQIKDCKIKIVVLESVIEILQKIRNKKEVD